MSEVRQVLVDIEPSAGRIPSAVLREAGPVKVRLSGKVVVNASSREQGSPACRALAGSFDISFCDRKQLSDFSFYPVPEFFIFATDRQGGSIGTIGGLGDLVDDAYPVGYVEGGAGHKVADSLRDFFEMAVYYPCWREVLRSVREHEPYSLVELLADYEANNAGSGSARQVLQHELKLRHNPRSIEKLLACMRERAALTVYASKSEAARVNQFQEIG